MKRIIFRVDDRLIHGQVIEGWIKHFKIPQVIVVNDRIAHDALQRMIMENSVPNGVGVQFYPLDEFLRGSISSGGDDFLLYIFESVADLYRCRQMLGDDVYLNVGCVASRQHKYEISDTVFLDKEEIVQLNEIRNTQMVHIQKLPWETSVEIRNVQNLVGDDAG